MSKKRYGPKPALFHTVNKEKYNGSYPIIARSTWETSAMRYFDKCTSCISWGSESAVVRYFDPVKKKMRRYFTDFTAVFKTKDGTIKKYIIEVKPARQCIKPKPSKRKKAKTFLNECNTYNTNMAKWEAADKWAKSKGYIFLILTEKELFNM